jgi:hypothetical protein
LNFYAYADGNPVSYLDPFGLCALGETGGNSWLRTGASIGVGFIPLVGTVQSLVELISGQDYIAGEETSRFWAGVGMVAGILPGGKGLIKGGTKVLSHTDDVTRVVSHSDDIARLANDAAKGAEDVLVLGRGPLDRLQRLATQEGGRVSTIDSTVAKEIFKNNYRDIRSADKIIQYMDNIPTTLQESLQIGGQYSRAEVFMINQRKDLLQKTIRKFENPP